MSYPYFNMAATTLQIYFRFRMCYGHSLKSRYMCILQTKFRRGVSSQSMDETFILVVFRPHWAGELTAIIRTTYTCYN